MAGDDYHEDVDHDNEDVDDELMMVKSVILLLVKTTQSWLPKGLVKIILMVMIIVFDKKYNL